jgi:SAM-dependent methyltransferase
MAEDNDAHLRAGSFGAAAAEYDRIRPDPPVAALRWILTGQEQIVVDLAAGTGQVTRQLLRLGLDVLAVEPDPRMRAVLAARHPSVRARNGVAEEIPLDDASVDAVLVGSAWHWFDAGRALAEIHRVLRPGGRLGVIGTVPDPTVPWVAEVRGVDSEQARQRLRRSYLDVEVNGDFFGPRELAEFTSTRVWPTDDLHRIFGTNSQYLVSSVDEQAAADTGLKRILDRHLPSSDTIEVPYRSWCWRTEKRR